MSKNVDTRPAIASDDVEAWIRRSWGDAVMAVHGRLYDVLQLPAIVAVKSDEVVGVLTYALVEHELEIVSCDATPKDAGTGRALVAACLESARGRGVRRVWCTTTNDNLPALGFWQAVGFRLSDLRPDAVELARCLKPTIPLSGYRGLPIRDEFDLEYFLVEDS